MKKFLHSDWLQYSFHVTPMQKRANTVQNIVNSVKKNGNEPLNSLKEKGTSKIFVLWRNTLIWPNAQSCLESWNESFLYVFSLFFVSALLGEAISKVRSFINELEVSRFFLGKLEWVSTRNFQKDYKLSLFKKTWVFVPNVAWSSAITSTNNEITASLSDSNYSEIFR